MIYRGESRGYGEGCDINLFFKNTIRVMTNDVCKQSCMEKMVSAQKKEGLSNLEVGNIFGIAVTDVSMIKNPKFWFKISEKKWESLLKWVNSGKRLREYGSSLQNVATEQNAVPEDKSATFKVVEVGETGSSDVESKESVSENLSETGERFSASTIQEDTTLIAEKDKKAHDNDTIYAINLAELGWIIANLKGGDGVAKVSKKLKIYDKIVERIAKEVFPAERGEGPKACVPVTQTVTIDLRILINGEPVKLQS